MQAATKGTAEAAFLYAEKAKSEDLFVDQTDALGFEVEKLPPEIVTAYRMTRQQLLEFRAEESLVAEEGHVELLPKQWERVPENE